jgi:hypothetical protein
MGKGSRNAAMLAESQQRLAAQEELKMATMAANMAVDMQGERSSKPSKKEKDKKDKERWVVVNPKDGSITGSLKTGQASSRSDCLIWEAWPPHKGSTKDGAI